MVKKLNFILFFICFFCIANADDIINTTQKDIFESKYKKGFLEGEIESDSWINPLNVVLEASKTKEVGAEVKVDSKKAYLSFEQEIYKSGAILNTIRKGKILFKLNINEVDREKKELISTLYSYVINLKQYDLQIKKLYFLIENKKIEITTKEASYTKGLVDISDLDNSVIELSELENQVEDIKIQKLELLKKFTKYSEVSYEKVDLDFLVPPSLDAFINKNLAIKEKVLKSKNYILETSITKSEYLPKLSIYGEHGYNDYDTDEDDYYSYGVKLSIPFDFSSSDEKQKAKIEELISKKELEQTKEYERNFYKYAFENLKFINNKIKNTDKTIKRYKSLYKRVNSLYENSLKTIEDVEIMKNRVEANTIDKLILELDKKQILNELYAHI